MRFRQPLVLLLGSVMSASSIGCSAVTAIISDSRPVNRANRSDADRLTAIARVFENQGRYDKAELLYGKALKSRPQDAELRKHLQQLAERRKEKKFGPTETANAIARADVVSPPKSDVRPVQKKVIDTSQTSPFLKTSVAASIEVPTIVQQPPTLPTQVASAPVVQVSSSKPVATPEVEMTSGDNQGWRSSQHHAINSEDIMIALEQPDNHIDLLLAAMNSGDGVETKSLAASLLGDCDPANPRVREALVQHHGLQSDPAILIALCDSQIERHEANQQTANCLLGLCRGDDSEIKIQAASQLRNFVGTEQELRCRTALSELLGSAEPNVRAIAAVTLGDFASLESSTLTRLQELADADADPNVRATAHSALTRQKSDRLQVVPALSQASE